MYGRLDAAECYRFFGLKHNPLLDKFLLNSYRYKLHKGDGKAPKRHEVKLFSTTLTAVNVIHVSAVKVCLWL
jgi:hypothetical protein